MKLNPTIVPMQRAALGASGQISGFNPNQMQLRGNPLEFNRFYGTVGQAATTPMAKLRSCSVQHSAPLARSPASTRTRCNSAATRSSSTGSTAPWARQPRRPWRSSDLAACSTRRLWPDLRLQPEPDATPRQPARVQPVLRHRGPGSHDAHGEAPILQRAALGASGQISGFNPNQMQLRGNPLEFNRFYGTVGQAATTPMAKL